MQFNSDYVPPQSGTFRCIKITLIVFQVLGIIGSIIIIVIGFAALGVADERPEAEQKNIRFGGTFLIIVGIIGILIAILGLFGAIKENFNLVVAYGVVMALSAIGNFVSGSALSGVFGLVLAGISFYYAYLINRVVRGQNNLA